MSAKDFYQLLNLSYEASTKEISLAIRQAERDEILDKELLERISATLLDPKQRIQYNAHLGKTTLSGNFLRSPVKWTARQWYIVSVCLWLVALCLPCLLPADYSDEAVAPIPYYGVFILPFGWLQPFAWFANFFILFAWVQLSNPYKKPPLFAVIIASLFALDMFRLKAVDFWLPDARAVYAYGLGSLSWLLSICVLWIAVGQRQKEIAGLTTKPFSFFHNLGGTLKILGSLASALILVGGIVSKVIDRHGASYWEQSRLTWSFYKLGPVCQRAPDYAAPSVPVKVNGVLEIINEPSKYRLRNDMRLDPEILAISGVSIVRKNGTDYRLIHDGQQRIVAMTPAANSPADAVLYTCSGERCPPLQNESTNRGDLAMSLQILGESQPRFRYVWNTHGGKCSPFGGPDKDQPKRLLQSALGLTFAELKTFFIKQKNPVCLQQPQSIEQASFEGRMPESCSEYVNFYFGESDKVLATVCNDAYYVVKRASQPQEGLYLQKITRQSLQTQWRIHFPLDGKYFGYRQPIQIEERGNELFVKLFENNTKTVTTVRVSLPRARDLCVEKVE